MRPVLLVLMTCSLSAWAAAPGDRPRVVVLGIAASEPALERVATSVGEALLTELQRTRRVEVIGASDLATMLGLERQKQLLGCTEAAATECMAEISSAMGAPFVVQGALGRAGKLTRLDLKLIRAKDGKVIWRDGQAFADESELYAVAATLAKGLVAELGVDGPVADKPAAPIRWGPVITLGVGALVFAGGGAIVIAERIHGDQLQREIPGMPIGEALTRTSAVNGNIFVSSLVAGVGGAAVIGGLLWFFAGKPAEVTASVVLLPGGAGLALGGVW